MMTLTRTFFVTLSLNSALFLVGCNGSEAPAPSAQVAGIEGKLAQSLVGGDWCSSTQVDDKGLIRLTKFVFGLKGQYTQTRLMLQQNGSLLVESSGTGTWAVLNDQVYLLHNDITESKQVTPNVRATDKARCFNFDSGGTSVQLCPCEP